MNNKRQTIWLVSMLSLMVILSAYYLFTEDVTPVNQTAGQNGAYQVEDATGAGPNANANGGVEATEADGSGTNGDAASTDAPAATDGKDSQEGQSAGDQDGATSQQDEAVLQGMDNQTGTAYFDQLALNRMTAYDQEEERLNDIIADTSNHSQDEAAAAMEKLSRMDATEQRIASLEEKLTSEYANAVVEEEDNNFKVVVQADKLAKNQAVSIVETATKELNVTPDRVTVQYIPNP